MRCCTLPRSFFFANRSLYYRVVRLPPEADPKGPVTSVCVEIEDTVAPEVVEEDAADQLAPQQAISGAEEKNAEDASAARLRKKTAKLKNVEFFFDMTRRNSAHCSLCVACSCLLCLSHLSCL